MHHTRTRRLAAISAAVLAGLLSTAVASSPAQASETADWLPLKVGNGVVEVGCTWDNGCTGGYHGSDKPAIDFIVPIGTAVYAAGAGTVVAVNGSCTSTCDDRGRYVEITHSDGRKSRYLHLSSTAVANGQVVSRGQHIGYSGDTMANGVPHLHYDEMVGSSKVDPGPMYAMHNSTLVQYPDTLGYTSWNQVPAWSDKFVWNDSYAAAPAGLAVELVHFWQSGSGATDAVKVTPNGVVGGGQTIFGAVTPGNGQFGLGDFNGDGVQDLYLVVTQGDPSGKSVVFVAAGPSFTSFLATVQTPMGQFGPDHGDVVIGDFTGDGKADVGVLFANNGAPNAAFGVLNAATTFQSWSYLNTIPIGGHDGTRSDAVAGDFNHDQVLDLGIGFHQGTPTNNVDFFLLNGASSYQSVSSYTLPLGGWQNGQGQLLSGRFGTSYDQLGAVYTANTPSGKPDLFVLNGTNTIAGSWTLQVGAAPANQRTFIGM